MCVFILRIDRKRTRWIEFPGIRLGGHRRRRAIGRWRRWRAIGGRGSGPVRGAVHRGRHPARRLRDTEKKSRKREREKRNRGTCCGEDDVGTAEEGLLLDGE
jgi:hypothetical protein